MRKIQWILVMLYYASMLNGQIVANHSVVDKYNDIPQEFIDEVKKMWLVVAGESHSKAYRDGLLGLESEDPSFAVSVTTEGTPEAYTSSYLRTSRATWGDIDNNSGWIYSYGEEDWCAFGAPSYALNPQATERTTAGISYCNSNDLTISAFGFGWCYDDGYELVHSYIDATKEYIKYCSQNDIKTVVFFTTGPVDSYLAEGTKNAFENAQRWATIRDTVNNESSRVLFDYADILSYNSAGEQATATWNGNTFPVLHPENLGGGYTGHIGDEGALKLAKAMWWMLARISGWDDVTSVLSHGPEESKVTYEICADQISIISPDMYLDGHLKLYNANGNLVDAEEVYSNITYLNTSQLSEGIYFVIISKDGNREVSKIPVFL